MKLMDSVSFQCFTRVSNQMHVTKLVSLGWMITLWIINEFEEEYSKEFTNCILINDDVSVPVLKTADTKFFYAVKFLLQFFSLGVLYEDWL